MSKKFKFGLSIVLFSLSAMAIAQNQYGNRVVVIPLLGDESTWQGPWQIGVVYKTADIIEEGGSSYIAVKPHTASLANIPPDAEFWEVVAESGANGAAGPQGVKGEKGDSGDTGQVGEIGATGPQGMKGDQGDVGAIGPQGMKGDQGDVGAVGPQGMKGDQGDVGAIGPQGMKGDQGDVGAAGPQGMKGDQGDVGAIGPQGMKGDQGDVGAAGPQGMKGDQGDVGAAGPQGMKGDQGDIGLTGMGIPGPTGATGADGSQFPPDGTTTFEKIPDPMLPDEKVISGISYTAENAISITTPDAMKPDEKVISGISYTAGTSISIATPDAMKPNEKVINFAPAQPRTRDNYQPSLGVNYIIALQGTFPSRSSDTPFIAEIIMFGGNFAPRGWALCDGQLLAINSNQALFSILGTTYGGDGRTTFGLPDLRGRSAIHPGNGPGLNSRRLGEKFGTQTINLD